MLIKELDQEFGKRVKARAKELTRLHLAEEVCKDLRRVITMRDCDRTQQDWSTLLDRLQKWMKIAGKTRYDYPAP